MNYEIELKDTIDDLWRARPAVKLGRTGCANQSVDIFGLVTCNEIPLFSIGICADEGEYICFREAIVWQKWAVIGYGCSVYFVDVKKQESRQHWLDKIKTMPYFSHFYTGSDYLLVATGSNVWRFNINAEVVWVSPDVAIDGVLIHDVKDDIIRGDGEWDPPGGWLPFTINLSNGQIVERGQPWYEQQSG